MKCLTFDVGGTFIKHAIVENGIVSEKHRVPTPHVPLLHRRDVDAATAELYINRRQEYYAIIRSVYERYGKGTDGIAMSVPGILNAQTGYLYTGGSLCYLYELDLAGIISGLCDGKPVTIENDAKAAATAELTAGVLVGVRNAAVILFGTGVGGCTVIDGRIVRGEHFYAGEYSYICTGKKENGGIDVWGDSGSVHRLYEEYSRRSHLSEAGITGEELFFRANNGDRLALECIRKFCHEMCYPICVVQSVIDTDVIAIGGGISAQNLFIETLRQEMEKVSLDFYDGFPKPKLVNCKYRETANLLGAYYHFCDSMKGEIMFHAG